MNFKRTMAIGLMGVFFSVSAVADGTEKASNGPSLDKLSEMETRLKRELAVEKLKASIAAERDSYMSESESKDLQETIESKQKEIDELRQSLSEMASMNNELRNNRSSSQDDDRVSSSYVRRAFVTEVSGREDSMEAEIYFQGEFSRYAEGDSLMDGVTIQSVSVDGVYAKTNDGRKIRLIEKPKKRAIIESLDISTGQSSQEPPPMEYDEENGFVVPEI